MWGQLGRVADVGLNALWAIVVARQLAPDAYGSYAVLLGVVSTLGLLASLGVGETLARFVPGYLAHGRSGALAALLRWALLVRGGAALAGGLALVAGSGLLATWLNEPRLPTFAPLLACLLLAQSAVDALTALFGALLRTRAIAAYRSAGQVVGFGVALLLFWLRGPELVAALIGTALSLGVTALLLGLGLRRTELAAVLAAPPGTPSAPLTNPSAGRGDGSPPSAAGTAAGPPALPVTRAAIGESGPRWQSGTAPVATALPAPAPVAQRTAGGPAAAAAGAEVRAWLRFAAPIWLTALVTFGLASQVDVLLIGVLLPDRAEAGFYGLAALIASRVYSLANGWAAVLMPSAARAHALDPAVGLARWFRPYARLEFAAGVPVFVLLAITAPAVVTVFGAGYGPVAPLLAWTSLFAVLSSALSAQVALVLLYVVDRQRAVLWLRCGAGVANVVLDVLLIPPLGPLGAVLATGLCNVATHAITLALALRDGRAVPPLDFYARMGVATAVGALGPLLLRPASLPGLLVAGAVFGALLLAALAVVKPFTAEDRAFGERLRPGLGRLLAPFTRPE